MTLTVDSRALDMEHAFRNEPRTGRYCSVCEETWHEPYAHKCGQFWHMPASNGAYYFVTLSACMCRGFHFKKHCTHLTQANELNRAGKKHSLAHRTWVRYEQHRWPDDLGMDEIKGSID